MKTSITIEEVAARLPDCYARDLCNDLTRKHEPDEEYVYDVSMSDALFRTLVLDEYWDVHLAGLAYAAAEAVIHSEDTAPEARPSHVG